VQIEIAKDAEKYISKLDKPTKKKIRDGILGLTESPPKGDIKPLQGRKGEYRLRLGKYRILYKYSDSNVFKILHINKVDSRGDVYK